MKESADSYKVGVATRSGGRRQPAACRMTVTTCIDAYTAGPNTSMRQHCDLRVCEPSVAKYSRAATSIPHPRAPKMLVLCCCRIQLAKKKGKAWHLARLSHTIHLIYNVLINYSYFEIQRGQIPPKPHDVLVMAYTPSVLNYKSFQEFWRVKNFQV